MSAAATSYSHESLNELSDYFHAAPIGLHITEADGTIKTTNLAELELLGYRDSPGDYIGRHAGEFHSDDIGEMFDSVMSGKPVPEREATLVRKDGSTQRVLQYANARVENGEFAGVRCCTFPHPDDLRPDIAELGALRDESLENRGIALSPEERNQTYRDLSDFFDNCPVALHIVGGDGLIRRANRRELESMGYEADSYIGKHIATFHADQAVIDGMLTDLVGGSPLINFSATLFHQSGQRMPVMIYSNSRMRNGSFINTRCFTVPVPKMRKVPETAEQFSWPRNEDLGFTVAGRDQIAPKPNPMTLALRYIAARKRPEESLGFLARLSQVLATAGSLNDLLANAAKLCTPFLADFVSIDTQSRHLADAATRTVQPQAKKILHLLESVTGQVQGCAALKDIDDIRAAELRKLGVGDLFIVEMSMRGAYVGTVAMLRQNAPSSHAFGPADIALVEETARRIATAIEIGTLTEMQ